MTTYQQGKSDGRNFYAKCFNVFTPSGRVVRKMNEAEQAEYLRGYAEGKGSVDGRRLVALGYESI